MTNLLVFKEKLKQFYSKNDFYLIPLLKFAAVFAVVMTMNSEIGFMAPLKNIAVVLIIALMSSFLPMSLVVLILALVIVAHLYALSLEIAAVVAVLMLIMFLAYYRFTPRDGIVLMVLPFFFMLNIPYVVPIAVGLIATPVSIVSVSFGTILYYIVHFVSENTALINNVDGDNVMMKISTLLQGVLGSKDMYLAIVAFAIVVIVVYVIRRLSIDHSWAIAIVTGSIVNLAVFLIGNIAMKITDGTSTLMLIVGTVISLALAFVLQFFVFSVDYSRTEHTQFEDDEYYYYVKAVPKINVTAPEVSVKRINARRTRRVKNN